MNERTNVSSVAGRLWDECGRPANHDECIWIVAELLVSTRRDEETRRIRSAISSAVEVEEKQDVIEDDKVDEEIARASVVAAKKKRRDRMESQEPKMGWKDYVPIVFGLVLIIVFVLALPLLGMIAISLVLDPESGFWSEYIGTSILMLFAWLAICITKAS